MVDSFIDVQEMPKKPKGKKREWVIVEHTLTERAFKTGGFPISKPFRNHDKAVTAANEIKQARIYAKN